MTLALDRHTQVDVGQLALASPSVLEFRLRLVCKARTNSAQECPVQDDACPDPVEGRDACRPVLPVESTCAAMLSGHQIVFWLSCEIAWRSERIRWGFGNRTIARRSV